MTRKREKQIKALCEINGINPVFIFRNKLAGVGYAFFRIRGKKKEQAGREAKEKKKKSTSGMRKENRNRRSCMEGRKNK